ncbi:restriction endonuclease subunit S [Novacetimonas hansenii]|uniref:Restriction endonuclease subunit S n=1 Tax=Novacetimonas hansenii TaxID=436 RepID=A0AAW5EN41_NOVHA|nr:restriction endonuclease subunit S [Novacetimonas hansenii]MCJ8352680.1 restriction endonuclease subunit S [Novacetimonas hansenii]
MSFPKYPAYKDSGVEWIGRIPAEWTLSRIGSCFAERRQKVSDADYPPLSVTKNGIVPQLETAAKTDDNNNRKCVISGDFVINSRSDRKGSSGVSPQDGSVSLINTVISPLKSIYGRFCHHLLRSTAFQEEYYKYGKGIVADLWSTNYNEMKLIYLALPPLPEQQAIASFLDRECGKIDALIAEQERLIALLAEKRQGVISHAVTKGLNPNVPMKDSGIPWIGMVPEGWDYSRLRFVAQFNPSKTEISYLPLNEEISFLPMEAIGDDGTINLEQKRKISDVQNGYTYFRNMDIVFAKITPCFENGKGAVVKGLLRGVGFGTTELIVARSVPSRVIPEYLFLFFQSDIFRKPAEASMYGAGGQKRVSERFVRDFSISLPPLPEQQAIASFLDLECRKIDTLIAEQKAMLALCKERRAALISAAVTGKIDVRAQSKARAA